MTEPCVRSLYVVLQDRWLSIQPLAPKLRLPATDFRRLQNSPASSLYCNNIYHPIFNNITFNEHWLPLHAEDAGYKNSNRVLQWNINDETEKYDDINAWQTATGGIQLGSDGGNSDTTIRVAEFPSRENSGKAIVIGDPSFEWKNSNEESNSIHNNLTKLATNTISYLIGQSNNK